MATKIFYNENRIIVDGHADTAEECRAITAMCDSMANNENFKTIVYEEGHAVFEQVSGGENMMFTTAMKDYVLTSRYNSETGYSAAELAAKGTIKKRLADLENDYTVLNSKFNDERDSTKVDSLAFKIARLTEQLDTLKYRFDNLEDRFDPLATRIFFLFPANAEVGQYLKVSDVDENGEITALKAVSAPAEYTLPYTSSELVEKLSKL
jgi:hypothetical protein